MQSSQAFTAYLPPGRSEILLTAAASGVVGIVNSIITYQVIFESYDVGC